MNKDVNETEISFTTTELTESVVDATIEENEITTVNETEPEPSTNEVKPGDAISTERFFITVPDFWQYKDAYKVTGKNEDGCYSLIVRYKESYGIGYGGIFLQSSIIQFQKDRVIF